MSATRGARLALIAIAVLAIGIAAYFARSHYLDGQVAHRERLGLMTSLPIYWAEGAGIDDVVQGRAQIPWVRQVLESNYRLIPLDSLAAAGSGQGDVPDQDPLAGLRYLLIVQPRGLSPGDNVALDDWVRAGGHVIYVLDPMLTGNYAVPLGDPRHPTLIGMLPPVLPRWGLEMQFTERQQFGVHDVQTRMGAIPVMLAGQILLNEQGRQQCSLDGDGLVAVCTVGKGRVTVIADAALFEFPEGEGDDRETLLALTANGFE